MKYSSILLINDCCIDICNCIIMKPDCIYIYIYLI